MLYNNVNIVLENVPHDLLSFSDDNNEEEKKNPAFLEENGNLLDSQRFNSQETMFIPHILTSEEISIAPDEVKNIFNDNHNI